MSEEDQQELARAYAADTGLSERVCIAFIKRDIEPPQRDYVDRFGFSPAQLDALKKANYYTPLEDPDA